MDTAKREAVREVLQKIPSGDAEKLGAYIEELVSEATARELPKHFEGFQHALGMTDEVFSVASRIAGEYKMPRSEVLLKALGLLKVALDARSAGYRIAILDSNDEIVQDVVGFEASEPAVQSPS